MNALYAHVVYVRTPGDGWPVGTTYIMVLCLPCFLKSGCSCRSTAIASYDTVLFARYLHGICLAFENTTSHTYSTDCTYTLRMYMLLRWVITLLFELFMYIHQEVGGYYCIIMILSMLWLLRVCVQEHCYNLLMTL